MKNAGDYPFSFNWMKRTTMKNTTNGQEEETFTNNGLLWGSIDETTGQESVEYGALQSNVTAVITLRNWPDVSACDRLESRGWGTTYLLTGVRWGANETICDAVRYEADILSDHD